MAASSRTLFEIPPENRERVRRALRDLLEAEAPLTLRALTTAARVAKADAALLLRAYRSGVLGLDAAWDGTLVAEDLTRRVREATTDRDRAQLCGDLAAALHLGLIDPTIGRAMGALIAEARQCDRAAREGEGDVEAEPTYLLSETGILVARAVDFLVSPELRQEALEYARELTRRDLERFPNPAQAEVEALRKEASHGLL